MTGKQSRFFHPYVFARLLSLLALVASVPCEPLFANTSPGYSLVQLSANKNLTVHANHVPSRIPAKGLHSRNADAWIGCVAPSIAIYGLTSCEVDAKHSRVGLDIIHKASAYKKPSKTGTDVVEPFHYSIASSFGIVVIGMLCQAWAFRRGDTIEVPKEGVLGIALVTTALQGGGIIFGFSAFAQELLTMPNTSFSTDSVSIIFGIGHQIMVVGCIVGGFALDYMSPRVFAVAGFIIEAVGHMLLMHADKLPHAATIAAYGMIGWGGCQIFLVGLSFVSAFERCNLIASVFTAFFQMGGFVFMVLPYTGWKPFFLLYTILCLTGGCAAAVAYPRGKLQMCHVVEENVATNKGSVAEILCQERVVWFLAYFTLCGGALIYGIGEFPAALRAKDTCQWDEYVGDFKECEEQTTENELNFVVMPFVGNFILPCSLILGKMIDDWGFAIPAFISVLSVQGFLGTLWLLNLSGQYVTALIFNIANSTVFTIQNAYICSLGSNHVGELFAISNLLLGLGNFLTDWLNTNPFGSSENKVTRSLATSCSICFAVTCPAYVWVLVEARRRRENQPKSCINAQKVEETLVRSVS